MNPGRLEALTAHLKDKAERSITLTPDGVEFLKVTLDDLPSDIRHNAELVTRLNRIAEMAVASNDVKKSRHPQRLEKKIYRLIEDMKDPCIRAMLDKHFTSEKAAEILDEIELALGYEKTAFRTVVECSPPAITPVELAYIVAEELRAFGFIVNATNSNGLLVETLKSIGRKTGFKVNAEASARAAVKK